MTSKIVQCGCKVVQPFVNTALKIEARAVRHTAAVTGAVADQIAQHDLAGTDAAQASTRRFVAEQQALVGYRVARFFHEARFVASGEYFKDYDYKKFIIDIRTLTRMLFLVLVFHVLGRQSVFTPIVPGSPFVEALMTKPNPNY